MAAVLLKCKPMKKSFDPTRRNLAQAGASRTSILLWVALVTAVGAGGWWWSQRAADGLISGAGALSGPVVAASGAASGASAQANLASGAGPTGSANARRFAGANRVQPVSVAAARKQDVRVVLNAIGNISALNTATVRARVDGELKSIRFKEGQLVRAGALLAEIDPRSYEIALAQVQGQLAKDQASLKNAQVDVERYKDLLAKDSIARQQVDTQVALAQQLAAAVQTTQAQVDNAKLQLSYTKVTAPISGRLGLKQADLGNMVRASDTLGIVTITQTQPISVVFAVPEANLPQIVRKLKGKDPLGAEAWDREFKILLATGQVNTTDNAIDAVTGTIKVKAEFPNADGSLFPNQFVNIKLQVNTLQDALSIPSTAVQRGAQGTFVYVVKPDSNVAIRRIRLGTTEGDWVSVQGDLAAGDKVVTDGADRLRDGVKVEVITPTVRPGGAPDASGRFANASNSASSAAPAGPSSSPGQSNPASSVRADRPSANQAAGSRAVTEPSKPTLQAAPPTPDGGKPAAPTGASSGGSGAGWIDNLPPEAQDRARAMMSRLPPDEAARVNKMTQDERRAFFQQMRERRQQQQSQ